MANTSALIQIQNTAKKQPWLVLIASIIMTIVSFEPLSKWSAWLLYPYLAWIGFATYLTAAYALLN